MTEEVNRDLSFALRGFLNGIVGFFGKDSSGDLNVAHVDSEGALKISGALDFVADIEVLSLGSDNLDYDDVTTDNASFSTANSFGFTSISVTILNTDTVAIDFSFDGSTVHGTIDPSELKSISLDVAQTKVYFKSSGGSHTVKYWAI
jgi:hypothetical protein